MIITIIAITPTTIAIHHKDFLLFFESASPMWLTESSSIVDEKRVVYWDILCETIDCEETEGFNMKDEGVKIKDFENFRE